MSAAGFPARITHRDTDQLRIAALTDYLKTMQR